MHRRDEMSSVVIESGEQDDKSVPSPVIPIRKVLAGIPFGIFFSCEISSELAKNSHIAESVYGNGGNGFRRSERRVQ